MRASFLPLLARRSAFTLIELSVVVAIIALLASVATVRYQAALVRAKVGAVAADMHALNTAVYAYQSDNGECPKTQGPFAPSLLRRLSVLTSPICYISQLPQDPFQPLQQPYWRSLASGKTAYAEWDRYYVYNNAAAQHAGMRSEGTTEQRNGWSLTSAGPDRTIKFPYYYYGPSFAANNYHLNFVYDPSNGLRSAGEIFSRGGLSARR